MLWDAKLETGVDRIDDQHKELCRLVDILLDRNQDFRIEETIKFVGDYVVQHFSDEEALQVASQYPELPAHKVLHTDFIKVFIDLKTRYAEAEDDEEKELTILTINGVVVDWLRNHIMIHDRRFAEWYKQNG
ncbi:hemerythrin [Deltaproteobacteria bacterium]|nr:hemerythrin [Deltaproteobacteria bacterium]